MQNIAAERRKEMRMLLDAMPAPAMVLSGTNNLDATDEALMQPHAAIPVEPFSLGTASFSEEPSPALKEVKYLVPPRSPQDAHNPDSGIRYPSPELLSYPPPAPLSDSDNEVSLPPSMFINGSSLPTPNILSPPAPKSNSNMSSTTLLGLVVGISTIVTGVFFILAFIIFCVRHIVKRNHGHFVDCPSSPPKDNLYAKVPDNMNQKMPAIGVHFVPAPGKLFSLPPTISNEGSPSSIHSESEGHFLPHGHVAGLGLSAGNFTYAELARATNDFASANLLGEGGFGYVHKGVLPDLKLEQEVHARYLAPEYAQSGKVSEKSDVYSYGVMVLELITGCEPIIEMESTISLVTWARPLLRKVLENGNCAPLVDPRLQGNYNAKEMANMVSCAAACVRYSSWRRPGMSQIVRALEGDASPLDLDEAITPGHSSRIFDYHSWELSMSKFSLLFAGQQNAGDRSTDNTSVYNLYLSACSTDDGEKYSFEHRKDDGGKQKGNLII